MSRLQRNWIFVALVHWGAAGGWACASEGEDGSSFTRNDDSFDPSSPGDAAGGGPPEGPGAGEPTGGSGGGSQDGGGSGGSSQDDPNGDDSDDEEPPVCVTGTPPVAHEETIDITWQEMTGALEGSDHARGSGLSILNFRNFIWDQIMETGGTLNFCVRYESTVGVSATLRDQIEASIQRGIDQWVATLEGYDCWPHDRVTTKIVGWAAMSRATFEWADDDHPGVFYIGDDSFESAPQCAQACGRFFNREPGYTYPNCPGGRDNHYDMSLWLTEGMPGGAGGDWGQRLGRSAFTNAAAGGSVSHIFIHEVGHGFGLPDYYDPNWNAWAPPGTPKPPSVMVVGSGVSSVGEWDTWMMRHIWSNIRSRFE